jgi:hypothetical protein
MKHLFFKTTLILFAFILFNCESQTEEESYNPELPAITETGANTFGCKINGEIMIPRDSRKSQLGGIPTGVNYLFGGETDWIEASDKFTSRGGVAIKIPNLQTLKVGEYNIKTVVGGFAITHPNIVYIQAIHHNGFYGSQEDTGKIKITRYDNQVISGTFNCKLKNRDISDDFIEITEGRFDFNKSTINTTKFR